MRLWPGAAVKRRLIAGLLLVLLLFCIGCTPQEQTAEDAFYSFEDALGRTVSLDEPPQRVVALMGGFAETWLLAGGADTLVGVSDDAFEERGFELPEAVVSVGNFQSPSFEAILALEPDLVLLSAETARTDSHLALRGSLEGAGIEAAYFSVTHFADYLQMLEVCAGLCGQPQQYQTYGAAVERQVADVIAGGRRDDAPSFLLLITYSGGFRPQTSDSMTGRMLCELGCRNILDDDPSLLQDLSVEAVMAANPDYVFVIPMGNDGAAAERNLQETLAVNPAWSSLTAAQEGRFILLDKEKFLYKPNARWADSYAVLAGMLADGQAGDQESL